jgi:asparagine synthase (glutamine-hydrolysing)
MCGLTGYWQPRGESESILCQHVREMADALTHRGPDDSGAWVNAEAGIALGFRRLAILDLSPMGHQPMLSSDGQYVVLFNGEIYNYRDLRAELEKSGHRFRGQSDTEVILEGCVAWGVEPTLHRLMGMFAIALWDRRKRQLTLARDRVGKKPLYYARVGDVFLFGSELKALRVHPSFRPEIDRNTLALYLRYGYIPAPYSIYRGVHKLPAGHHAVIRTDLSLKVQPYWDVRKVVESLTANQWHLTEVAAIAQLDALLRDATARRMIADVPLGAFLSGGVDSSTIVALMQAQSSRPVKTFSIGFYIEGYNEAEAAKAVAQHLGTDHTELYVTPEEAQAVIPRLPNLYDEPFADSSQIPTFLVSELARRHVTVSLSGDGGDELFGGYTRYSWANAIWNRTRYVPAHFRQLAAGAIQLVSPATWDRIYGALERGVPDRWRQSLPGDKLHKLAGVLAARDSDALYLRLVSLWKAPNEIVISGKESETLLSDSTLRRSLPDFTERMMYLDLVTYLPDDILVKVDRATMGVSLEARAPLLDHRVVEWAWRLPLSFRLRNGQSKWLLRQVLYRYVPPELIERPKTGFGVPIDAWLRGPLRDWAEELLDERRIRHEGFLRPEPIREAWTAHLGEHRNEQYRLWVILMFQAWKEAWSA